MGVVQDIQNDIERGAARLVAEYRSRLMRDAVGLCGDAAEAEDFVFRTFDKAIRNIDSFREEGSLYDWMKAILVNDVRSAHRSKVVQNTIVSDMSRETSQIEPSTATEEAVMNDSDDELVREAIARLPESQRDVILLHYFKDWPVARMAKFLALSETTVKFRLLAGRKALAAIISRQMKRPVVRVALVALLCLGAAFAATVAVRALSGGQDAATPGAEAAQAAEEYDIFDATQQGENMIMTRKMASLVGASMLAMASPGNELTTEPTFVFLRPETSSFWNTATNNTMTLPIDFPKGATKATLTVSGVGYETRTYPDLTDTSFDLELPEPDSPQSENVYDLVLTFDDGTVRTAKLGLVQGLSPDAEGTTRCLAPANGRIWEGVKSPRAVLPIPYDTTSFTVTVNGETQSADTGLNGAQGWYALGVKPGDSVSLSMIASGLPYSASLIGTGGGLLLIYK